MSRNQSLREYTALVRAETALFHVVNGENELTLDEYLQGTESAFRKLFHARQSYIQILKDAPNAALVGTLPESGDIDSRIAAWTSENKLAIDKALTAQRRFFAESVAHAAICGSILQLAYMALQLYSKNTEVPTDFQSMMKPNAVKFCIGRYIRGVPAGLIVYAGRNQYSHMDESQLSPLNTAVFEALANNYISDVRDPAFDFRGRKLLTYAANIVSLLGWGTYQVFRIDLVSMLSAPSQSSDGGSLQ